MTGLWAQCSEEPQLGGAVTSRHQKEAGRSSVTPGAQTLVGWAWSSPDVRILCQVIINGRGLATSPLTASGLLVV